MVKRKNCDFFLVEEIYKSQFGEWILTDAGRRNSGRMSDNNYCPVPTFEFEVIENARQFMKIQAEYGSFDAYIWSFVDNCPIYNHFNTIDEVPAKTPLSDRISKDLKKRGFKFVGSTIIYAYMQAVGIVNDHVKCCHLYQPR